MSDSCNKTLTGFDLVVGRIVFGNATASTKLLCAEVSNLVCGCVVDEETQRSSYHILVIRNRCEKIPLLIPDGGNQLLQYLSQLKYIQKINLNQCELFSTLPLTFTSRFLSGLSLNNNYLTGTVSSNLQRISSLSLEYNYLSGPMVSVDTPRMLNEFYVVILDHNYFTGTLTCLAVVVSVSENFISGNIPSCLLTNTVNVKLMNNFLTGRLELNKGAIVSTQILLLSKNMLTGTIPTELLLAKSVVNLALDSNLFTGSIGQCILPNLVISNNLLTGVLGNVRASHILASNNFFSGSFPFIDTRVIFNLDLSMNLLTQSFNGYLNIVGFNKFFNFSVNYLTDVGSVTNILLPVAVSSIYLYEPST